MELCKDCGSEDVIKFIHHTACATCGYVCETKESELYV